jgi:sporulation protein YlmC with PRC-barrel domain
MEINFEIGQGTKHKVNILYSIFGLEIYKVDGKEIMRKRSFSIRGNRKFAIANNENNYEIEIKYDMVPKIKSWIFPGDWIAQVYVNGNLFISGLTPSSRETIRKIDQASNKVLLFWLIVFLITFTSFLLKNFFFNK